MTRRADFTGFTAFELTRVQVTNRHCGHGSYATVQELEYMGLKCAGKKIHDLLLEQGDTNYTVRRFEEECRLLSQIRHPNIVQFLGVHFQPGVRVPILVMEFLPTNLTSCIEQYGILPNEISYSILHDVALGLCYLHTQTPPIIHRDLSSNNVLLTANMTAKISDLGVAKILNLTPLQVSRMTQTPGTPAYMPPEVMVANPKYDTSVDEFSYGILMIHMLSGRWPEPQVGPNRTDGDQLIPVTEAERREVFLQDIGNDHPLMGLILVCVNNNPQRRAHAGDIVERLAAMVLQSPASFVNRLEMLRYAEQQEEEKQALREDRAAENRQNQKEISSLREDTQEKAEEIDRLNLVHTSEVEELQLQLRDLSTQIELLVAKHEADTTKLKADIAIYEAQIESNEAFKVQQVRESGTHMTNISEQSQDLHTEISKSKLNLLQKVSTLEAEMSKQCAMVTTKETELGIMSRALEEKDFIISALTNQLSRAREYLSSKEQALRVGVNWKQCADIPIKVSGANATVINGKVYCGGGFTGDDDNDYVIYRYDTARDIWSPLPPLPVKWFGLGQVQGKPVAVGGWKESNDSRTNEVYTYYEQSKKWKQTIPPMPTARNSASVTSLVSALIVAGGCIHNACINTVEVFKSDTSKWYTTNPLPMACCHISLTTIDDTCYALGGYRHPSHLNQAHYTSLDDLLSKAELPNPTISDISRRDTLTTWKTMPHTPLYEATATVLANSLLILGGRESPEGMDSGRKVYVHSPSTNSWICASDLPAPRAGMAAAVLSSTEVLVIGGWSYGKTSTVYKGTLCLKT